MNTAEIITNAYDDPFFEYNSNKDFNFVGLVIKTSWLIYSRRSVKFHYVKETHMMLVALVKIVVASQHKKQRNENTRTRT